jgi:hypothetical protein
LQEARGIMTAGESLKINVEKGHFVKNEDYKANVLNKFIIKKTTSRIASLYEYPS